MGIVYEAVQTSLGRRVALKVLPTGALLTRSAPERFAREARAAARLQHPHIVPVYAVGEEQGVQYYVMQFIEGALVGRAFTRLAPPMARRPAASTSSASPAGGQQIAEALEYATSTGHHPP